MAVNGWLAADSDMHVMEPADLWQRYMDPKWGLLTPIGLEDSVRDMRVKLKSVIQPNRGAGPFAGNPYNPAQEAALRESEERGWDARSQVLAMEAEHLDSTVLFPSRGLFAISLPSSHHVGPKGLEPGLATAIAAAYNDWMADFVADCERPGQVFGAAMRSTNWPVTSSAASRRLSSAPACPTAGRGMTRSTTRSGRRPSDWACQSVSMGAGLRSRTSPSGSTSAR